jgi:Na+/H+ antiporter NhaB
MKKTYKLMKTIKPSWYALRIILFILLLPIILLAMFLVGLGDTLERKWYKKKLKS